jgi:hypothetical protein
VDAIGHWGPIIWNSGGPGLSGVVAFCGLGSTLPECGGSVWGMAEQQTKGSY